MTVTISLPASPTCNACLVERCTQEAEMIGVGAGLGVLWRGPSVSTQRPRGSVTSCRTSPQFKRTRESGTKREGGRRKLSPCPFPPLPSLPLQTAWKPVIPMIPPGRALLWALWLILGASAVKASVFGQSQGGADWAGGSEGDTGPARIPNIAKRDEPGLVGKTIDLEESEDDELAAPAAAELLEDSLSLESGEQQEQGLEEGQEVDGDEKQKEDRGNDEDLAQEDDEDQDQELNGKEEQEQHSRDSGQDQGQNQEQGEMQELKEEGEQEQERDRGGRGREEAREQMQGLEEQRQGQGKEKAAGLDHELKQMQVKKQKEPQEQQQIQAQRQKLGQPRAKEQRQIQVQGQPQVKNPLQISVPAVEQQQAQEPQHIQAQKQVRGQPHIQAQKQVKGQPHIQAQKQVKGQPHIQAQKQVKGQPHIQAQKRVKEQPHIQAQKRVKEQPHIRAQKRVKEPRQIQVQKQKQQQQQIQAQGQKLEQPQAKEQRQIPLQITVPAVEQLAQEQPQVQEQTAMEQQQIPVPWEGQPQLPPQAKAQEPGLVLVQAPTQGPVEEQLFLEASEQASMGLRPELRSNSSEFFPSPDVGAYEPQQPVPEQGLSNLGQVPPPEMHLMMLAWGPWECHCPTGTMSRVRGGKFLDFTGRLRSGPLSRLQTQRQPCTYARCHCNQEKKECPLDHVSCSSIPGACNRRASLTPLGNPENTINETIFWKQVREGLEEVWLGLQSLVTKEKRIKRNQR
ncbi:protein MENT [Notamacropus eugenii]|uniref:protein MENT n=1 Tax=Notamacropus eugenii TaxID=9315 RepID=UPI003B681C2E